MNAGLPLDDRTVVANVTARDAIAAGRRFIGMTVFVVSDSLNYQLVGGVLNANWQEFAGGGGGGGGGYPIGFTDDTQGENATLVPLSTHVRLNGDGSGNCSIQGMTAAPEGQVVTIFNNMGGWVEFFNEAGTIAEDGFYLPNGFILVQEAFASFVYDGVMTRWMLQCTSPSNRIQSNEVLIGTATGSDVLITALTGVDPLGAPPYLAFDTFSAQWMYNNGNGAALEPMGSPSGVTKEPTGFPNRTDSVMTFDDVTREFAIDPVGTSFDVYVKGRKYIRSGTQSVILSNDSGNHYIYFDVDGSLTSTIIFDPSLFENNAFVSIIYYNTNTSTHSYFADERHGLVMDGVTHGYLHTVFGARYISGLALQNFEIDGTGDSGIEAQFEGDVGSIRDEDILISLDASAYMPVLFREGLQWRKKTADAFPVIYNGTAGYTGTRLAYNQFTGGAWQLTEVTNGDFVLCHVFATNDYENPYVAILGVNSYTTTPSARAAAETEISSLSGLPFAEFVAVGTVIFQTNSAYTNAPKARVRSAAAGENYVDFRGEQLYTPSGIATSHSLLSNLSSDDHPQYVKKAGDTMTGTLGGVAPTLPEHLTTKQYVDDAISGGGGASPYVAKTGDTMSGPLGIEDVDNFTSYSTTQIQVASNLNDNNSSLRVDHLEISGTVGDLFKQAHVYQDSMGVGRDDNVSGASWRASVNHNGITLVENNGLGGGPFAPLPATPFHLTTKRYVDQQIAAIAAGIVQLEPLSFTAQYGYIHIITDAIGTVTLPTPVANGKITLKASPVSTPIQVVRAGSEMIDFVADDYWDLQPNQTIVLVTNGTDWYLI